MLKLQWFTISFSPYSPGWSLWNKVESFTLGVDGSNLSGISGYRDWKCDVVSSDYVGFRFMTHENKACTEDHLWSRHMSHCGAHPSCILFCTTPDCAYFVLNCSVMFVFQYYPLLCKHVQSAVTLGLHSSTLPADINGKVVIRKWSEAAMTWFKELSWCCWIQGGKLQTSVR